MTLLVKLSKKTVAAQLVKENPASVWVRLPDGAVIKRSKRRHVITTADVLERVLDSKLEEKEKANGLL